LTKASRIKKVI